MILQNGEVYTPDHKFVRRSLAIENGRFSATASDRTAIDASGCYVIPGLVDIHIHGGRGCDFGDATADSLHRIASYEAENGITAFCPTSMTMPKEDICRSAAVLKDFREDSGDAAVLGMNMEGPFISPEKKGSQESRNILDPDPEFVRELQRISGNRIRLVDFAPERPGASQFVEELAGTVTLSVAHTNADYETALSAMKKGAHHVTHLYNAMTPYQHRAPGVVGAASDDPECMVELIADGLHNHPTVVRNTFRIFGPERVVLISDSMEATGCPDGTYTLGGHEVFVHGKEARLKDGTIAASVSNLMDCLRVCVLQMGIPLEDAVRCAAENPARSIGQFSTRGSIEVGKTADAVLLRKKDLSVQQVILRGRILTM